MSTEQHSRDTCTEGLECRICWPSHGVKTGRISGKTPTTVITDKLETTEERREYIDDAVRHARLNHPRPLLFSLLDEYRNALTCMPFAWTTAHQERVDKARLAVIREYEHFAGSNSATDLNARYETENNIDLARRKLSELTCPNDPRLPLLHQRAGDPVHKHTDGTHWFWDETWADELGPYYSETAAHKACDAYADKMLGSQWLDKWDESPKPTERTRPACVGTNGKHEVGCYLAPSDGNLLYRIHLELARGHSSMALQVVAAALEFKPLPACATCDLIAVTAQVENAEERRRPAVMSVSCEVPTHKLKDNPFPGMQTEGRRRPTGQCSWGCYISEDGKLVRDSACTVHGADSTSK